MNILLGVTGSVAAIKTPELVISLEELGEVRVVITSSARKIIRKIKGHKIGVSVLLSTLPDGGCSPVARLIDDEDEWAWGQIGDPVLHIDLKDWADVLVIAPLTANTLAKMVHGLCDNLLTCIYRAWPRDKNIIVAPAMNTDMWENYLTYDHLKALQERHTIRQKLEYDEYTKRYNSDVEWITYRATMQLGLDVYYVQYDRWHVVQPVEKKLACGTTGMGAMAKVSDIVEAVRKYGSEKPA